MKELIVKSLSKHLTLEKKEIEKLIEIPPNPELGDFAFPCFHLAKLFKKAPVEIAKSLASQIKATKEIEKIQAVGPYINFFVNKKYIINQLLKSIKIKKQKGKIALEHTSLNPNSSPHVGRARNSLIGDSIKRILEFQGYDVTTYYYVNDISKQIAILALAFKGNESFNDLLSLYVKTNKKLENNPRLEEKVFKLLEKFESGDAKTKSLFKKIVNIALKGQLKILKEFGIAFDKIDYESNYIKAGNRILEEFKKTGKLSKDKDGRFILDESGFSLESQMKSPVLVLTRSNGTGLYVLRDLAYTLDKLKRCKKSLIVLGEDQKLYFQQLKAALSILKEPSPKAIHYSYVLIQDEDKIGKMATRSGNVVLLEDFMKEAQEKAKEEIKKRKTSGDPKKIGYGAVKYALLRNDPDKNIIFNWEQALNFEGNSGPYLQYSYARASSILRKAKTKKSNNKFQIQETNKKEISLLKKTAEFSDKITQASSNYDPSIIANYAFELAQSFNEFYHLSQVLGSPQEAFRLKIVQLFAKALKDSLNLLGIEAIEKM